VGISSVAGFRGLSSTPVYSASKAALSTYMEGIRNHLKQHNIAVTVLNPGFIDTPINTHRRSRPFLISSEKGAYLMADMIEKKVWSSTVPVWPWAIITEIMRQLPERLWSKINV
ncbi:MAG: SDR family NAD(P)-dependent oxidoreductase, partial [Candidatus Marinimicrobia bacterium]|nr:SDR family NAD(P)-dependent oxidoreductase [Candidatus Neomarinimicrobiota bacterium]